MGRACTASRRFPLLFLQASTFPLKPEHDRLHTSATLDAQARKMRQRAHRDSVKEPSQDEVWHRGHNQRKWGRLCRLQILSKQSPDRRRPHRLDFVGQRARRWAYVVSFSPDGKPGLNSLRAPNIGILKCRRYAQGTCDPCDALCRARPRPSRCPSWHFQALARRRRFRQS